MNFFTGVIVGIVLATVGAGGIANWVDRGVAVIKREATSMSKGNAHSGISLPKMPGDHLPTLPPFMPFSGDKKD